MRYTENFLSGISLTGHGSFREYLLKNGKKGDFHYDLDQFHHELRTSSLRKDDAGAVVDFLGEFMESIGASKLRIVSYEDQKKTLFAFIRGNKFPKVAVEFDLGFMEPSAFIINHGVGLKSDPLHLDLEKYKGSEEYVAWEIAKSRIENEAKEGLLNGKIEIIYDEQTTNLFTFGAKTNKEPGAKTNKEPFLGKIFTLDNLIERTVIAADAIERAYLATQNLPRLHHQRIEKLAEQLTTQPDQK